MPASRQRRRSSSKAFAVTATIGGHLMPSARRRAGGCARRASSPSITGMCTSISTRSIGSFRARQEAPERVDGVAAVPACADLAARLLQQASRQQRIDVVVLDQEGADRLAAARLPLALRRDHWRRLAAPRQSRSRCRRARIADALGERDRRRSPHPAAPEMRPWPQYPARRCLARSGRAPLRARARSAWQPPRGRKPRRPEWS